MSKYSSTSSLTLLSLIILVAFQVQWAAMAQDSCPAVLTGTALQRLASACAPTPSGGVTPDCCEQVGALNSTCLCSPLSGVWETPQDLRESALLCNVGDPLVGRCRAAGCSMVTQNDFQRLVGTCTPPGITIPPRETDLLAISLCCDGLRTLINSDCVCSLTPGLVVHRNIRFGGRICEVPIPETIGQCQNWELI